MWWRCLLYQHVYYHVNHILWFGHNLLQKAREGHFPEKVIRDSLAALRAWFSSPNLGSRCPLRYLVGAVLLQLLVNRVRGSLVSEGSQSSLWRCLGYLTVQLLAEDLKVLKVFDLKKIWRSLKAFAASFVPCPSFGHFSLTLCPGSSMLLFAWEGLLQSKQLPRAVWNFPSTK